LPDDVDFNDPFFKDAFGPEFKNQSKKSKATKQSEKDAIDEEAEEKKRAELELLLLGQHDKQQIISKESSKEEKKSKKKKKKAVEKHADKIDDSFKVDVNDSRFSALFTSHLYNVDQSNPMFKKSKGMEAIIGEKMKRRTDVEGESAGPTKKAKHQEAEPPKRTKDPELSSLVKSIKRKASEIGSKRWK